MFTCSNCSLVCKSLVSYSQHINLHRNEKNVIFTCGTPGCSRSFSVFSTLKAHISRNHQKISISQRKPHFNLCDVSFKCHIEMCAFQCKDIDDFFTHLRYHIRGGVSVACPFKKCRNTKIKVVSSFTSHLSRFHQDRSLSLFSDSVIYSDRVCLETISDHGFEQETECLGVNEIDTDNGLLPQEEDISVKSSVQFRNSLGLFYLRMQAELLLPASTIELLVTNFNDIHTAGESFKSSQVLKKLNELNISNEDAQKIIAELQNVDLIKKV